MPDLILVRHAQSDAQPGCSPHEWGLTAAGRASIAALARHLRPYRPSCICTSAEPKTMQTAQGLAAELGLPCTPVDGLQEQRRETMPWYNDLADFRAAVRSVLLHPDALMLGEETGRAAADRFQAAVEGLLARYPDETMVVVTHGTVLSLYLARAADVEPVEFWEVLGMPAYVVLSRPDLRLLKVVNTVE